MAGAEPGAGVSSPLPRVGGRFWGVVRDAVPGSGAAGGTCGPRAGGVRARDGGRRGCAPGAGRAGTWPLASVVCFQWRLEVCVRTWSAAAVCLRLCLRLWLSLLSVRPWARDACARALPARRVCASAGSRWPGSGGHEWARVWLFLPPTLARLCVVVGLRSYECLRRAACCCYCVCEPEAARAEFLECAHSGALCGWLRPGHPPAPFNISLPPPGHFQDR